METEPEQEMLLCVLRKEVPQTKQLRWGWWGVGKCTQKSRECCKAEHNQVCEHVKYISNKIEIGGEK